MTDTTNICGAIKGLPDNANVEVYPPDYNSDDFLAQWKAKVLKALVAENESLREAVKRFMCDSSMDCTECEPLRQKFFQPTTADGGNDDRS